MPDFSPYSPFASAAASAPRVQLQWPSFRPAQAAMAPPAAAMGADAYRANAMGASASGLSTGVSGWFQSMMARIKGWFRSPFSQEPGPPLATVPITAAYRSVQLDRSSPQAAVLGAASFVRQNYPQYFTSGDNRAVAMQMMTTTIGILRANGLDAHRVVNYADRAVGDPNRYGKDALVLNGRVFDCYLAWPESGRPQALDVGAWDRNRAQGARE